MNDFETQPIDLAVLGQLLNNDPAKISRFALKFLDTSRTALAEMQAAHASRDFEALTRLCHKHKSAAASVGARSSAALYKLLEEASLSGDGQQVQALLVQFPPLVDQIAVQVERETG